MGEISEARLQLVRGLIEQAPDAAVHSLSLALGAARDESLARVRSLVEAETADRTSRNRVLAPIAPLCGAPNPFVSLAFPARVLPLLWRALKETAADVFTAQADAAAADELCARAAAGLRSDASAFAAATAAADAGSGRQALAACLDIAPLTRQAVAHLPEWLGRITDERAAQLRLTYRDVGAVADDAGPRFFEMLTAHLAEPWLILRVISGMMDHPPEAYLSASELAIFPMRTMDDVDRRLIAAARFQAADGRQAARQSADLVHTIAMEITECEQSIRLAADGPWSQRIAQQKRRLASMVEEQLDLIEEALARALPVHTVRRGAKARHAVPTLDHDPEASAVERAAALLIFLSGVRPSATAGGFASARAKVLEAADARVDAYVEDLLEELRGAEPPDAGRARAFLDVAAEFCGFVRDEQAARIVRRRAAAAAA